MEVKYISHMGNDLSVVNAARVSFNKKSEWDHRLGKDKPVGASYPLVLSEQDERLVKYLAKHGHWTPFGHTSITLHMKMPMFVQRQIDKHQVGFVVNEVSRRYVDDEPEFYLPKWRERPEGSVKQGSGAEIEDHEYLDDCWDRVIESSRDMYESLLASGVAPEQARAVLPMCMYTESWKTGSLAAWARLYSLRIDAHAQKETQEVAEQVGKIIELLFPVSWKALTE